MLNEHFLHFDIDLDSWMNALLNCILKLV